MSEGGFARGTSHAGSASGSAAPAQRERSPQEKAVAAQGIATNIASHHARVTTRVAAKTSAASAGDGAAYAVARKDAEAAIRWLESASAEAEVAVADAEPTTAATLQGLADTIAIAKVSVATAPPAPVEASATCSCDDALRAALPPLEAPPGVSDPAVIDAITRVIRFQFAPSDLGPVKALFADAATRQPSSDLARRVARLDRTTQEQFRAMLASAKLRGEIIVGHRDRVAAKKADAAARVAADLGAALGVSPEIHAGEDARTATEARGAKGVAHGSAVSIHPDVDPSTPDGRGVIAHEVVHQAQAQLPAAQDAGRGAAEAEAAQLAAVAATGATPPAPQLAIDLAQPAANTDAAREPSTADVSAARFLEEASRKHTNVTAKEYVRAHLLPHIGPALQQLLRKLHFALPERMTWGDTDLSFPLEVLGRLDDVFGGDTFHGLPELLAPADLWELVDANRMITDANMQVGDLFLPPAAQAGLKHGGKGPIGWREQVGIAIASRFEERLGESLPRMATRYLAAFDALAVDDAPRPVASSDLIPSHPMDRLVARALCRDGMIHVRTASGGAVTTAAAHHKPRRIKTLTWVRDPGMWNWVKVTEPADATAEEVAYHLWHDYSAASRLEVRLPFFGLTVEDASHFPEARAHQADPVGGDLDPARASQIRAHLTHDPAIGDRGGQLAASSAAAASAQAVRVAPDAEATTIDEAAAAPTNAAHVYEGVVEQLDAITRLVAPLGLASELGPVRFRAAVKQQQLATAPAALAGRELTIAAAQRAVLLQIGEPLAQLATQLRARTGAHTAVAATGAPPDAALGAVAALVHAAALSETAEIAEAALVSAMAQQRLVATDALEAMLAEAMQKVDGVRMQLGSATTPNTSDALKLDYAGSLAHQVGRSKAVFGAGLDARHIALRARVEALRARFLAGEPVAPAELRQIFDEVDALRFEAETLANLGGVTALLPTLDTLADNGFHKFLALDSKALDLVGGPVLAHLRKDNHLEDLYGTGVMIVGELEGAHGRWLAAVASIDETYDDQPRAARIERAAAELVRIRASIDALAHNDQVVAYFRHAYATVEDEQQRQMIARIAAFIGIAIVATAVGNVAGAAVSTAADSAVLGQIAAVATETLANATLTAAVNGGNFKQEVLANAGATIVTIGSLKMAAELFDAARVARAVTSAEKAGLGARVAEVSVHTGLTAISAVAGMQIDDAIRGGSGLSIDQLNAQSAHALALMVGQTVGARVLARPLAHLRAAGARGGELIKRYRALGDRARALGASGSPAEAHAVLAQERALYTDEIALLTDLATDPHALHAAHLDAGQVEGLIAGTAAVRADVDGATQARLGAELGGLDPVIPGHTYRGTAAQVDATVAAFRKDGFTIEELPAADGKSTMVATAPDGAGRVELIAHSDIANASSSASPTPRDTTGDMEAVAAPVDVASTAAAPSTGAPAAAVAQRPGGRVSAPKDGVYEDVATSADLPGWSFEDNRQREPDGTIVIETNVEADGKTGYIERAYNPKTKTFEMRNAFLEKLPRWVDAGTPLVDGKGTPTVAYLSMRQMKLLGADYGSIEHVKMSTIQNVKAIIQMHVLRAQGMDRNLAVLQTHSVEYAETTIVQSGHKVVAAEVSGDIWDRPLDFLLNHYERRDPSLVARHDQLIAEFGQGIVARDTVVWMNYDIHLDVAPFPAGGN